MAQWRCEDEGWLDKAMRGVMDRMARRGWAGTAVRKGALMELLKHFKMALAFPKADFTFSISVTQFYY